MIRSLFSAVSGLVNHQLAMDVIGNNISNIDTVGFKASTTNFAEAFSQTTRLADQSTPIGLSVGLGSRVTGTTTDFGQGALQRTDVPSDIAISGNGFFIVDTQLNSSSVGSASSNTYYTRAGDFIVDVNGYLRTADGYYVQGYSSVDSTAVAASTLSISASLGGTGETTGFGQLLYNADGTLFTDADGKTVTTVAADYVNLTPASTGLQQTDLSAIRIPQSIVTGTGTPPSYEAVTNYNIGTDGAVTVVGQDGTSVVVGYVPLATVSNDAGLNTVGGGYYQTTQASGQPDIYQASVGTTGSLQSGALELSNSDVATQFSNMIIIQNGYNANAKVITTSSQMLQVAINMVQ